MLLITLQSARPYVEQTDHLRLELEAALNFHTEDAAIRQTHQCLMLTLLRLTSEVEIASEDLHTSVHECFVEFNSL